MEAEEAAYAVENDDGAQILSLAFVRLLLDEMVTKTASPGERPPWIQRELKLTGGRTELTGSAAALQRMLDAGVSNEDVTAVVREQQWNALYNVCQILDGDPTWMAFLREKIPGVPDASFRLVDVRQGWFGEVPGKPIPNLHPHFDEYASSDE